MIEIIPKPAQKTPWLSNALLYFSLAALLAAVLGYAGIDYFYNKSLAVSSGLEESLIREKTPAETSAEAEVLNYKKKINDFAFIFEKHRTTQNVFKILELDNHPKVWFSGVTLDPAKGEAVLSGEADNFRVLGEQIIILQNEKNIQNINLSNIAINKEGRVNFALALLFPHQIFK